MANPKDVTRLSNGVPAWNRWKIEQHNAGTIDDRRFVVDLVGADLRGASLRSADLRDANLSGANLADADLSNANLRSADLTHANLSDVNLTRADLQFAQMDNVVMNRAMLHGAAMCGAQMITANLRGANLSRANLDGAYLLGADFTFATLDYANFNGAELNGAILQGARLAGTVLTGTNLDRTTCLDSCVHVGPSYVDPLTLARAGNLPLSFLRGCGLPEQLIEYLPSLREGASIQFFSCFISYSTNDQDFATRLHADLQSNGVRCWFAPHDMQPGKKIHEQIDAAIRVYDRLLLVLSTASMSSNWVKAEIAKARQKEVTSHHRVLFPLALVPFDDIRAWEQFNAELGEDTAKEIREFFIPDFSEWKNHDRYQVSFGKILRALQSPT